MINSKQKGARGERAIAKILREHGYDNARRTAQYCGKTEESSDVVGLPGFHVEVKCVEHLNIYNAIEQAKRDNGDSKNIPVVFHKKNNKQWLCTLDLEEFLKIIQEIK